jgi:release factor glutamine methyltransferase
LKRGRFKQHPTRTFQTASIKQHTFYSPFITTTPAGLKISQSTAKVTPANLLMERWPDYISTATNRYFCGMTLSRLRSFLSEQLQSVYDSREAGNIAVLILQHFTGYTPSQMALYARQEQPASVQTAVQAALQRLLLHEPVQYVLGEAWFDGRPFFVNEAVLIPRPETEELVALTEALWRSEAPRREPVIVDIGTGSGCIAISLKKRLHAATVVAVDVSDAALAVARKNALLHEADVEFIHADFRDDTSWNLLPMADIIVSNPPYIPLSGKKEMQEHVTDHEPHTALFVPDHEPLLFYSLLANFGKTHLQEGGWLTCEIHESFGGNCVRLFEDSGYRDVTVHLDMQCKERFVTMRMCLG